MKQSKQLKLGIFVFAFLIVLFLIGPFTFYRAAEVLNSTLLSKIVNQNVYCYAKRFDPYDGCFNLTEKITWSNYNAIEIDFNETNRNNEADRIFSKLTWAEVIILFLIIILIDKRKSIFKWVSSLNRGK